MNSTVLDLPALLPGQLVAWQSPVLYAAALALAALWLCSGRSSSQNGWAAIPGPAPASRLLGHVQQVNVQAVHRCFQDWCQQYGGGGLYRLRLLHLKIVVLCDPVLVQAVLSRAADMPKAAEIYDGVDELFSARGHRSFFNTHDAEDWRVVRKGTAPAFSPENIRKAFPLLLKITSELCDVLAAKVAGGEGSAKVDVAEAAMRITLDVIGTTGCGYDFKARHYKECEMFEVIPPMLGEFTLRSTNPLRALVHRLAPWLPEARLFRQRVKASHKWWDVLVKSVRATDLGAADAARDTSLRVCLAKLPLDDERLTPQVAVYLIAGFETTAHSIAWALYEIAADPAVQDKVAAELAAAGLLGPGARQLEFADLAGLTYLNVVLKESMRLHPVASSGTIRKANKAINLGGYHLPAGTILWVPLIAVLTSRHNWDRSEEFWPERWAPEAAGQQQVAGAGAGEAATAGPTPQGNAANPAKTYLPFSDGPRDCIGQNLAVMEARAVLAVLVGRFHLHCPSSREEVRASEVMKLTLQCAGGMNLTLKLRE